VEKRIKFATGKFWLTWKQTNETMWAGLKTLLIGDITGSWKEEL